MFDIKNMHQQVWPSLSIDETGGPYMLDIKETGVNKCDPVAGLEKEYVLSRARQANELNDLWFP